MDEKKTDSHIVNIGSIGVKFPFEPYDLQKEYMTKVVECLTHARFGLLESPTGTGKTLSLLCASLAWLENEKIARKIHALSGGSYPNPNPSAASSSNPLGRIKIIYASRTHSQLSQVISEFSNTEYRHLTSSVLGSRDQLCVNQSVLSVTNVDKNILCRSKIRSKACEFHNNLEKDVDHIIANQDPDQNDDIENLKKIGLKKKICPYYLSRSKSSNADIVFLPYNYLFDAKIRKTLSVELEGCVIILDEAHNVLRNCEDANSLRFESKDLAIAITELDYVVGVFENEALLENLEAVEFSVAEICSLKEILCKFETGLVDLAANSGKDFEGDKIFELLEGSGVNSETYAEVKILLDKISNFLISASLTGGQAKGRGVSVFQSILDLVFQDAKSIKELLKTFFKLYLERDLSKKNVIFNLWCFSPGFCMKSLVETGVRSIILTSGTLKPMKSFGMELCTDFEVTLQNKHVIQNEQLYVRVIPNGIDKTPLSSAFNTRSDPKYLHSLGFTIMKLFRNVPGGVLIFFPSYSVMNSCIEFWQNNASIWTGMNSAKTIYVEPKQKGILPQVVSDYREAVKVSGGACFMAVMRGKVAEGIDFADKDARAVIITGIPFPNVMDARISLKRKYLDFRKTLEASSSLSGNDWYNLEAYRAINQAIGRVIRHKDDYGSVLFLDKRFSASNVKSQLSDWIQPGFQIATDFEAVIQDLKSFFKMSSAKHPVDTVAKSEKPKLKSKKPATSEVLPLPPLKKKKIVIKPSTSSNVEVKSKDNAQNLVIKLKKRLTKEEMIEFKNFVKEYKMNNDFEFIRNLIQRSWFQAKLDMSEKTDFAAFIKDDHKAQYSSLL